jgi:hypothetical protein
MLNVMSTIQSQRKHNRFTVVPKDLESILTKFFELLKIIPDDFFNITLKIKVLFKILILLNLIRHILITTSDFNIYSINYKFKYI